MNTNYIDCIECVESLINSSDCDSYICCGDFNTSFERHNAQTNYLTDFISRNNLVLSWDHHLANKDFTYVNHALGHKSFIDHFIVSRNIFDTIINTSVLCDPINPIINPIII